MNIFAAFFNWLAPSLTAWFVAFISRKMVTAGVTVGTFVLLTAAFVVCIKTIVGSLIGMFAIPPWLTGGVGMFLPSNFLMILSSVMSAKACRFAYDLATTKLHLLNSSN